jgi:ribosomal protein L31
MTTRLYTPIEGVKPEPVKYGLLNSKTLAGVASNGERWETGISVDSLACNSTTKITSICSPASSVSGTEPSGGPWTAEPFNVEAAYECSTFGFNANNYREKAEIALEVCEGKLIEHEFWTGELAQQDTDNLTRYLASDDAVDVTPTPGTAVQPKFGLVLLEQALANCGCGAQGVIHATRGTASALEKLIIPQEDYLETRIGTLVVAGSDTPAQAQTENFRVELRSGCTPQAQ